MGMGIASKMSDIQHKVEQGERLSLEDGLFLYESDDLLTLGQLANTVNMRKNGKRVYFIENMSLYFTNVCEEHCAFCHFRKDEGETGAYTLEPEEMVRFVEQHGYDGLREFHIVGGHNPHRPFSYYVDSLRALKQHFPQIALKAYTAAEIDFFSRISGLTYEEVLKTLIHAGLDTLTGGGAEILTDRYRKKMRVNKVASEQWLEVHEVAHQLGLRTHATMLYGAIETYEERLLHMLQIRELQDRTNGFMVFIPNAVQPPPINSGLKKRVSATDNLKTIAISRLMLDNFDHIKAYYINLGTQLTQLALAFGASDVHGTIVKEKISHSAGAQSPDGLTREELIWLIHGANRTAVLRDTFYNTLEEYHCS